MTPNRRLLIALLWASMAALLYVALRQAPLAEIWAVLQRLRAWQLLALAALNGVILALLAARWQIGLAALGARVSLKALLSYRLAGSAVSYLTPGPQFGGEPLQVHLLYRKQGVDLPSAASSVYLDRLVDLLANFTFLAVGVTVLLLGGLGGWGLRLPLALLSGGLLLMPLAHLVLLWSGRRPAGRAVTRLGRRYGFARRLAELACAAEAQIADFLRQQPRTFLRIAGLAALAWLLMVVEFWLSLRFLGVPASLVEAVAAQTAARLAFLLPFPAGLGALEASQVLATRLLGWEPAVGVALSLLIRARDLLLALVGISLGGTAYRLAGAGRGALDERS